jgi:hypothetical protein
MGEGPPAICQRQEESRNTKADHDRGQGQRLRYRVDELFSMSITVDDRRFASAPAGCEQQQVDRVADEAQAHDDPGE